MVDRIEGDSAVAGDEKGLEGVALSRSVFDLEIWLLRRRAGKAPVRCLFG